MDDDQAGTASRLIFLPLSPYLVRVTMVAYEDHLSRRVPLREGSFYGGDGSRQAIHRVQLLDLLEKRIRVGVCSGGRFFARVR